jgi:GNAT superfamily N-acetyltransferase
MAMPQRTLHYRPLTADKTVDVAALFALFKQASKYSLIVEGRLPTLGDAKEALCETPPGKDLQDKFFGGYWQDGTLVGCMDLIRSYPEPEIAYLGLLLFSESHQGHGLGFQALEHIAGMSRSWACTSLRLAVIDKNDRALAFWKREGFCELYRKPTSRFTGDAVVMQKAL